MAREPKLELQPVQAWAKPPAKLRGIRVFQVNLSPSTNYIETERTTSSSQGHPSYRNNRDRMPLTNHPCSWRHWGPLTNHLRRKLVQEIRISEKGRCTLMGLGIAQLNPFCSVEHVIWNRCCSTSCAYFSC